MYKIPCERQKVYLLGKHDNNGKTVLKKIYMKQKQNMEIKL